MGHGRGNHPDASSANDTSVVLAQPGRGKADRIDFLNEYQCKLQNALYTTCPVGNDDWFLKVGDLDSTRAERGNGAQRLAPLPRRADPVYALDEFPAQQRPQDRRAGAHLRHHPAAAASISWCPTTSISRPITMPPLYPRLCRKRGLQLGGECRYLLNDVHGVNRSGIPAQRQRGRPLRWACAQQHLSTRRHHRAGMLFNRVSDNDYFRDLSNLLAVTIALKPWTRKPGWPLNDPNWYGQYCARNSSRPCRIHLGHPHSRSPTPACLRHLRRHEDLR